MGGVESNGDNTLMYPDLPAKAGFEVLGFWQVSWLSRSLRLPIPF